MKIQHCKGFRDLSAADMKRFRLVEEAFRKVCLAWGYQEIRTPTLEYMHLFTSTGTFTPGLLNKVYSFLDWDGWSGERVVLRPDGTIPVARLYIDSLDKAELAKLFYVTNIFIFEETGTANREKWQGGVELIGANSPLADVELIMMAVDTIKNLNLGKIKIKLSHAGIIKALLEGLGLSHEQQIEVFDRILDGDISALEKIVPGKSSAGKTVISLLDLKGNSSALLKNLKSLYGQQFPGLNVPLNDFIRIVSLLEKLDVKFQIDMDTGRGFEYYTGVVFHVETGDTEVAGGGRYNALIPFLGGKDIPASGFALYLDKLMEIIPADSPALISSENGIIVRIEGDEPVMIKNGFDLVKSLHGKNSIAELSLNGYIPQGFHRIVDINKNQTLRLTDTINNQTTVVKNISELLKLIEYERTDKSSSAQRSSAH